MIPCVITRYLGPSAVASCGVSGADYVQPCEKSHPPPGTGVPLMWGTNTHTELLVPGLMPIHPCWSSDGSFQAMMVPIVARESGVCMHPSLTGHTLGSWFVPAKSHASMLSSAPARRSLSKLTESHLGLNDGHFLAVFPRSSLYLVMASQVPWTPGH